MLRAGGGDDRRARRTEQLLLEALIECSVQRGFAAVTVSDLANYAGINRATFYRHYEDKFDLLNHYAQTVYELLDSRPEAAFPAERPGTPVATGLVAIFEHIQANARFYRVMLGPAGDPGFADRIRQYVKQRIRRSLPAGLLGDASAVDLYLSYSASASIGAVLWWLNHDLPFSAAEMAALSYRVSMTLGQVLENRVPLG